MRPVAAPEVEPRQRRPTAALPAAPPPGLDGLRVLVVDDDADSRELLRAVLGGLGAVVTEASSVHEALEMLRGQWPDVMVADIGMPDQDGYELIGRVRRLEGEEGKRLPVVAVTAYAREHDRVRVLDAGFDSYLPKPVEPPAVARLVGELGGRADASG
jgi:CheY-like chemotaxis protein